MNDANYNVKHCLQKTTTKTTTKLSDSNFVSVSADSLLTSQVWWKTLSSFKNQNQTNKKQHKQQQQQQTAAAAAATTTTTTTTTKQQQQQQQLSKKCVIGPIINLGVY